MRVCVWLTLLANRKLVVLYLSTRSKTWKARRWEVGAIRYAGKRSRLCQSVANASVRNADKFPEELSGKMFDIMRTSTRNQRVSRILDIDGKKKIVLTTRIETKLNALTTFYRNRFKF